MKNDADYFFNVTKILCILCKNIDFSSGPDLN